MKRSFPINLAGTVFYIDEDAYTMLDTYLSNLRITFGSEDGGEIVDDIENRISEILSEHAGADNNRPISINDVDYVIGVIGSPEQVAGGSDEGKETETADAQATPPPFNSQEPVYVRRRLYRDVSDKVIGGVISGLCAYCGWSVMPARIIFAVGALCFPVLVIAYLVAWMLMPAAITAEQRLEMYGHEVNINNIGRTVQSDYTQRRPTQSTEVTINNLLSVCAKIVLGIMAFIAFPVAIASLILFVACLIGMIVWLLCSPADAIAMLSSFDVNMSMLYSHGAMSLALVMVWSVVVFIPSLLVLWGAIVAIFKAPSFSRGLIIGLVVMEILLIILGSVLGSIVL